MVYETPQIEKNHCLCISSMKTSLRAKRKRVDIVAEDKDVLADRLGEQGPLGVTDRIKRGFAQNA